jgi:hypothetical protein
VATAVAVQSSTEHCSHTWQYIVYTVAVVLSSKRVSTQPNECCSHQHLYLLHSLLLVLLLLLLLVLILALMSKQLVRTMHCSVQQVVVLIDQTCNCSFLPLADADIASI